MSNCQAGDDQAPQLSCGFFGAPGELAVLMLDETDVDEWRWSVPHRPPLSWYLAPHDRVPAGTLQGLKHWPPPDDVRGPANNSRTLRWVLGHVIHHQAYHADRRC